MRAVASLASPIATRLGSPYLTPSARTSRAAAAADSRSPLAIRPAPLCGNGGRRVPGTDPSQLAGDRPAGANRNRLPWHHAPGTGRRSKWRSWPPDVAALRPQGVGRRARRTPSTRQSDRPTRPHRALDQLVGGHPVVPGRWVLHACSKAIPTRSCSSVRWRRGGRGRLAPQPGRPGIPSMLARLCSSQESRMPSSPLAFDHFTAHLPDRVPRPRLRQPRRLPARCRCSRRRPPREALKPPIQMDAPRPTACALWATSRIRKTRTQHGCVPRPGSTIGIPWLSDQRLQGLALRRGSW